MVVGDKNETLEEKNSRHIKEMESDIKGWKYESEHAKKMLDNTYEKYCEIMIKICENTIRELQAFANENFKWNHEIWFDYI